MAVVCVLAGCGRLGFGVEGDDTLGDAPAGDSGGSGADAGLDGSTGVAAQAQASASVNVMGDVAMTLPAPSTPGSLLVVTMGTSTISNLGLPAGWMIAAEITISGGCLAAIAYMANNPGDITSVTFTQSAGVPTVAQLTEWAGVSTTAALDAIGTATGNQATMLSVQTATPTTAAGGVAVDVFCQAVTMPVYSAGAGWTNLASASNGPSVASFTTNYKLGLAAGVTIDETVTTTVAGKYAAAIATFRPQ